MRIKKPSIIGISSSLKPIGYHEKYDYFLVCVFGKVGTKG